MLAGAAAGGIAAGLRSAGLVGREANIVPGVDAVVALISSSIETLKRPGINI